VVVMVDDEVHCKRCVCGDAYYVQETNSTLEGRLLLLAVVHSTEHQQQPDPPTSCRWPMCSHDATMMLCGIFGITRVGLLASPSGFTVGAGCVDAPRETQPTSCC